MKAPAFQFYPADFLTGTDEMSSEEVGVYVRMLCYQWLKPEEGLPNDQDRLVRLTRYEKMTIPAGVMKKFKADKDGLLRNQRLEEERKKRADYVAKQAELANRRWAKKDSPPPAKEDSTHHQFIALWTERYKAVVGVPYTMDGGKDGKAVKKILGSTKMSPSELVAIAEKAWPRDGFECSQARTISGFASRFNQVRAAVLNNGVHKGKSVGTSTASDATF